MEEKILFQVKSGDAGTVIKCSADGMEECFRVATGVYELLRRSPGVALFFMAIQSNPEVLKKIEDNSVDMPDFDEILKNIK